MSDFSLTLVLPIKTSKIINDMAKVQQKSEKITAFGGIFFVLDKFDSILSSVIDSHFGTKEVVGIPRQTEKYIWLIAKGLANSVPPTRTHCVGGFCLWEFVLLHRQRTETGFDGAP